MLAGLVALALAAGCRPEPPDGDSYEVAYRVTPTTAQNEAEQSIAIDPNDPGNLVAAVIDAVGPGFYPATRYASSLTLDGGDDGRNWDDRFVPNASGVLQTGDGLAWQGSADPVVAIDRLGNVYLAQVYFGQDESSVAIYVSVAGLPTSAGPWQFDASQTIAVSPGDTTEDKPWLAVDNGESAYAGNVYVAWSHYDFAPDRGATIAFSRSLDHGATWSPRVALGPRVPAVSTDGLSGSQIAVGPEGEVYVVWEAVQSAGSQSEHLLVKSTDGGATFGEPVAIAPPFDDVGFGASYRLYSYTSCAVHPTNGELTCAWGDQQPDGARVELVRSTDGGETFSDPVALDPTDGHQFMPAIAVDEGGMLHAVWFDTRNSPNDTSRYDIYAARSDDGGRTWVSSTRVTSDLVDAGDTWFIGDYTGIAAANGVCWPVWTSGGLNGGSLETAALTWPSGR